MLSKGKLKHNEDFTVDLNPAPAHANMQTTCNQVQEERRSQYWQTFKSLMLDLDGNQER